MLELADMEYQNQNIENTKKYINLAVEQVYDHIDLKSNLE